MKRLLFSLLMGLMLFLDIASAAVISRDWTTPGDGLLTYDDVNRREWLDIDVTMQLPAPREVSILAELEPGGMFEGFVLANSTDVIELAQSAGIDTATRDYSINRDSTNELIRLLSETHATTTGTFSIGFIDLLPPDPRPVQLAGIFRVIAPNSLDEGDAGLRFGYASSLGLGDNSLTGALLYRPVVVPEPTSPILAIGGIAGLFLLLWRYQIGF